MIRRRVIERWCAVALTGVVAGVAAGIGVGVDVVPGAAADVVPRSGTATFTDLTGGGACALPGEPPDNLHVGLSTAEFGTADVCGAYLDVTGPRGTVRVQVTDHCRRCPEGTIDITRKAFTLIADVDAGRADVRYELVRNPPLAGPLAVRVKAGSSAWFLQLQVLDHGNPLDSVELASPGDGGGWRPLTRTADNHWQAAGPGPGEGPFTLRITDVHGQSATASGITLTPDAVQPTTARLYPAPAPPPVPAAPTTTTIPAATPPPPPPAPDTSSPGLLPLACAAALAATICARRMVGHRLTPR